MKNQKITQMSFAKVYPLYIAKAERKNRTKEEVDQIITWLTGYDQETLQQMADQPFILESTLAGANHCSKHSGKSPHCVFYAALLDDSL